ncbi:hypothetical protein [Treponema sp.]|uniref:hypothetical protein n=1 Tax=Treponema sp. TaxID=166 RepID=UPI003EFEFAC1
MFFKKYFIAAVFFISGAFCFSQVSVDPTDEFYKYAVIWENRGIVSYVPPTRPYPLANVKSILEEAIENGTEKDKKIASCIYERIMGKPYSVCVETDFFVKHTMEEKEDESTESDTSKMISFYPAIKGDFGFKDDFVSLGYSAGFSVLNATDTDFMPLYSNSMHDSIFDATEVGPIDMYLDVNTVVALGYKNLFVQGGVYRTGYSAFLNEGLTLNDTSYHSGNIAFTYMNDKLSYTQKISMIGATSSYDGDLSTLSPDKIIAFHAIGYEMFDFLKVSFYETAVYGKRLDLSYALPVPYMVAQGVGGASDNLAMGLLVDIKPAPGVLWQTDIMCDDFPAEDFFKLDFDSKYRLAVKTGLIYTPAESFLDRLDFNYTFITPYTYSHWQYDSDSVASITSSTINYQNCTNSGIPIGSQYEPNSDAVKFSVDLRPFERLTLSIGTVYSRHGNVCESLDTDEAMTYLLADENVYSTTGSLYTHSIFAANDSNSGNHVSSAWDAMNWLNQEHVQFTIQSSLNARYDFPATKKGKRVSLFGGVTMEYIHNDGVGRNIFPGGRLEGYEPVYENQEEQKGDIVGFKTPDGDVFKLDSPEAEEIVNRFKNEWVSQLRNTMNLYFNVGVSIRF